MSLFYHRALKLLQSPSPPHRPADTAFLCGLLTHPSSTATPALEALYMRLALGERPAPRLFHLIFSSALSVAFLSPTLALLTRALYVLTCLLRTHPPLLREPRLHSLGLALLSSSTPPRDLAYAILSLVDVALGVAPCADALVAAGLLPFLAGVAAAPGGAWPPLASTACFCMRNVTSGSEARKDAGVAAGLGAAAVAYIHAFLLPSHASDGVPSTLLMYADGKALVFRLEPGYDNERLMALDAAAMVLATLASESAFGGMPGARQEARSAALVASGNTLPALLAAWGQPPQPQPGVVLALRNFTGTYEQRRLLRAAAGSKGRMLLAALGLPREFCEEL